MGKVERLRDKLISLYGQARWQVTGVAGEERAYQHKEALDALIAAVRERRDREWLDQLVRYGDPVLRDAGGAFRNVPYSLAHAVGYLWRDGAWRKIEEVRE